MDDYKKLRFFAHKKSRDGEISIPSFGEGCELFMFYDIVLEDILHTGPDQCTQTLTPELGSQSVPDHRLSFRAAEIPCDPIVNRFEDLRPRHLLV
ncbi:hypothetical protein [Methanofollis sp. UBA420]|jgi:hypothetical protein|uniref:hypothetical protein n=1 Tax=Methanofollis sp. UBA420 TaxID=1915514 RepID=UPI00316AD11A